MSGNGCTDRCGFTRFSPQEAIPRSEVEQLRLGPGSQDFGLFARVPCSLSLKEFELSPNCRTLSFDRYLTQNLTHAFPSGKS